MIDLHLHLDGSLTAEEIWQLAKQQRLVLPVADLSALKKEITAPENCGSLNQYLKAFQIPLLVLQQEEAIFRAVSQLVSRLFAQGLAYAEIRFAPQLHCREGLSQLQVVQTAVNGLQDALERAQDGRTVQLILCMMRGDNNEKQNRETLAAAEKLLGNGVCAVDLAGAEALYPTALFASLFAEASYRRIPFTVHAGEAAGPESVWEALSFGAKRIGHGVRSIEDKRLVETLRDKNIILELCPTSNVQTKAVPGFSSYPIRFFMEQGVAVTVNTDNMTVSGTSIREECNRLRKYTGLIEQEKKQLMQNAARAAFLPDPEKRQLEALILNLYAQMEL